MSLGSQSVSRSFEIALRGVYGHNRFAVDETGQQGAFRMREDSRHFLKPLFVYTRALNTLRAAHALSHQWDGHFFLMHQLSGQLRVRFDGGAPSVLRAGDLLLMNPYQSAEFLSARANEVAVIPLPFDTAGGETAVLAACGRRIDHRQASGAVLRSALGALVSARTRTPEAEQPLMREVLGQLLRQVVEAEAGAAKPGAAPADTTKAGAAPAGGDGLMRRARHFALRELADPALSPDAIAAGIGVSRRHLYRAFAEHGQTPANWLWGLRTEQAHHRLTSPGERDRSLTELAFEVGFNDMAHFSRAYRARYGCTPRQARQQALHGAPG